ncbi:MAG: ParA family partition ATPase [Cyanobacteria bacterium P01_H01_bin.26]
MRIAIVSLKGGVSKSTLCVNIGAALSKLGRSVVVVDADPQGSINDWATIRDEVSRPPFTVLAAARKTLNRDIDALQGSHDDCLIDTPGRAEAITLAAISAADLVLIPISPSSYDLWAAEQTLERMDPIRAIYTDIKIAYVVSKAVVGSSLDRELRQVIKGMEGDLLKTVVHQRVAFQRCADGATIYELKDEKAQREVTNLTKEILKLMGVG